MMGFVNARLTQLARVMCVGAQSYACMTLHMDVECFRAMLMGPFSAGGAELLKLITDSELDAAAGVQ